MAQLDAGSRSIQSLYSMYSEGKIVVNRRYQRKLVWTTVEKQKLVESVVKKYPIPAVLLAARGEGYEVIDGLQRLHAIISYIETSFPSLDNVYFNTDNLVTAKNRVDQGLVELPTLEGDARWMTTEEVAPFLDYSLAVTVMRDATDAEIDDVFSRINTYGRRLSEQERRQAGVQSEFADLVRGLASEIRQDATASNIVDLNFMPSISIDLPMARHGYGTTASSTFWVSQGILRSTDLRDSMDEQCIADIAAIVVGGRMLNRSKNVLDALYETGSAESNQIATSVSTYGADKFRSELKHCLDELLRICNASPAVKVRDMVYPQGTNNSFPAVFAILVVAMHQALIRGEQKVTDYSAMRAALTGLAHRLSTGGQAAAERTSNVNVIKGLMGPHLIKDADLERIYGAHSSTDIDNLMRRSRIELPHFELKQGMLNLDDRRDVNVSVIEKVLRTICAIANNGPDHTGTPLIGVADTVRDASRVRDLDGISAITVGTERFVVGINREARILGESVEDYFARWKTAIRNAPIKPDSLRTGVLAAIDYHEYHGLGVIVVSVPATSELSSYDGVLQRREGDDTVAVTDPLEAVDLSQRFRSSR